MERTPSWQVCLLIVGLTLVAVGLVLWAWRWARIKWRRSEPSRLQDSRRMQVRVTMRVRAQFSAVQRVQVSGGVSQGSGFGAKR